MYYRDKIQNILSLHYLGNYLILMILIIGFVRFMNNFNNINLKHKIPLVDEILKALFFLLYKFCFGKLESQPGTKHFSGIFI